MELRLEHLVKDFSGTKAVNDVSITIQDGKLTGLLGPSGCGKSTTLYLISGLESPTSGRIFFGDRDVTALPPEKRGIGLVFQNYALYPHLTVEQNIIFPVLLDYQKPDRKYLEELLTVLRLRDRRHHLPNQLSGGQQQRVAIGRALITRPSLILADEPTGNLDTRNTSEVISLLKEASKQYEQTVILITHSRSIAQTADRILQVSDGVVTDFGRCYE